MTDMTLRIHTHTKHLSSNSCLLIFTYFLTILMFKTIIGSKSDIVFVPRCSLLLKPCTYVTQCISKDFISQGQTRHFFFVA